MPLGAMHIHPITQVPTGHIWIQGDNPTHSLDSRQYGPVPLALVKGRVLAQVWPTFKVMSGPEKPANNLGNKAKLAAEEAAAVKAAAASEP
jgi:hypothetical protein